MKKLVLLFVTIMFLATFTLIGCDQSTSQKGAPGTAAPAPEQGVPGTPAPAPAPEK